MKNFRLLVLSILVWNVAAPTAVFADDAALLERLNALEQEVRVLKRQLEVRKEEEDKKAKETPIITAASKDGFSIKSPDDNFKLKIGGYMQTDGRFFTDNNKKAEAAGTTDTFLVRTARLTAQGTVYKDYDFYLSPEFAGSSVNLPDAYIDVHYWPELKLRAGKFKEPVGIERLQSTPATTFAELGLPTNLVPNRDVGAQLYGDLWGDSVNYALGIFNGVEDLGTSITDGNNDKDIAARIFVYPFKNTDYEFFKGLGVGVATTYGHKEGSANTIPTYKSAGQSNFFTYNSGVTADGPNSRLSPQFTFYTGPLGVLGEYVTSSEELVRTSGSNIFREKITNDAWQIETSYVVTGEDASYKGVTPRHPFSWADKTWGAFEVAGRVGRLTIDDDAFRLGFANQTTAASRADAWGLGLNWYLNRNFKAVLDFERTDFTDGGPFNDRPSENVIFSRLQIVY